MLYKRHYPKINLRSKNEIAKRASSLGFTRKDALALINYVLKNFDACWYDSKRSEPEKGKYVRSAAKSPQLKRLLDLMNHKILAPYDALAPKFIFGGLFNRNSIQAARYLLGAKRKRVLIKMDVKSFFEQITEERVFSFFYKCCNCTEEAARILTRLVCVPSGPKGSGSSKKILARGFATSSRLAMWCNLGIFQHLEWMIKKQLRGHDPRIAIYVDDIGISASRVSIEEMEKIKLKAVYLLEHKDPHQALPTHRDGHKSVVRKFEDGVEHLGVRLGRKKLSLGGKTKSRVDKIKAALAKPSSKTVRTGLLKKYKAYQRYRKLVQGRPKNRNGSTG